MKIHIFVIVCIVSLSICENPFEWTDPDSGIKYDFTELKRDAR